MRSVEPQSLRLMEPLNAESHIVMIERRAGPDSFH